MMLVDFAIIVAFATIIGMWLDGVTGNISKVMHKRWYKKHMTSQGYKYNHWDAEWKLPGERGYNGEDPNAFKSFKRRPRIKIQGIDKAPADPAPYPA